MQFEVTYDITVELWIRGKKKKQIKPRQREMMKHYQVMRWDAISGIIEEDGLSARQRDEENPFKVGFSR